MKLLFMDLDGTLLLPDHMTISERTMRALNAVRERGATLCVCTGRTRCHLPPAVREAGYRYAISANGASCTDLASGEHLFTAYMTEAQARKAADLLAPLDPVTEWFVNDEIVIDRRNHNRWQDRIRAQWHRDYFAAGRGMIVETIGDYLDTGAPKLEKINVMAMTPELRQTVWDPLSEDPSFAVSSASGRNMEINCAEATKGRALHRLTALLGASIEDTYAFGDGGNDIEMMKAAGHAIAMGNALNSVKDIADEVTLSNAEDGVAKFIEEHIL